LPVPPFLASHIYRLFSRFRSLRMPFSPIIQEGY
jgi:hypothetical protein